MTPRSASPASTQRSTALTSPILSRSSTSACRARNSASARGSTYVAAVALPATAKLPALSSTTSRAACSDSPTSRRMRRA